jgi:L-2,4-diaminobutyrate decarboxylase
MSDEKNLIQSAFSAENFAAAAETVSRELKNYFLKAESEPRVRQWREPAELKAIAARELSPQKTSSIEQLAQICLENSHVLHSPRYMGHQVPPSLPVAALFDFIGSATNQAPGLYEMGPLATVAEKAVTSEMAKLIGWSDNDFSAVGTSGGSLANLTAILTARNIYFKDIWSEGIAQVQSRRGLRPAIAVGADSHYSVTRSAGILGLGADQVVKIPLDEKRRMDVTHLRKILAGAKEQGLEIFSVVATASSTPVGAFDNLDEIAAVVKEKNIWLHVDGAHGASVLFSKQHRSLLRGLDRADSVVWDAHKMMYAPALSTFVFYKNKNAKNLAFQQDAPYLHDPKNTRAAEYNGFLSTLECTKRPLALGVWAAWSHYGAALFEQLVDTTFARTREFYSLLKESDDFEPLHEPQGNILCFRYLPAKCREQSPEAISALQVTLRETLVKGGEYYTTSTKIDDLDYLRVTLINPLTTVDDLKGLIECLRRLAKPLVA